jgi:hypothetical protein
VNYKIYKSIFRFAVLGPQSGQMFIDHVARVGPSAPEERNVSFKKEYFAPTELQRSLGIPISINIWSLRDQQLEQR